MNTLARLEDAVKNDSVVTELLNAYSWIDNALAYANNEYYRSELMGFKYSYRILESLQQTFPQVMTSSISLAKELLLKRRASESGELRLQRLILKYQKLFFDTEILHLVDKYPYSRKHVPDFWLQNKNDYYPVEVKSSNFDKNALKQLNRYMKYYNKSYGYAIGSNCVVNLPSNITFVQITESIIEHKLINKKLLVEIPSNKSIILLIGLGIDKQLSIFDLLTPSKNRPLSEIEMYISKLDNLRGAR